MQPLAQSFLNNDETQTFSVIEQDAKTVISVITEKAPDIGIGLLCFIGLFILARPISMLIIKPIRLLSHSQLLRNVVRRIISFLIVMLGAYIFLRMAGLTQFAIAIVSGTGLVGLVVGFAFKDIAENFISSLLLSIQKPFRLGDVIEIEDHIGVVNQVTSRATTLVDFDGNHIQIPNATIYKNVMKNFTANPKMRTHFVVGIGFDASISEAQNLANQVLSKHESILRTPAPQVLVDELGSSTVNLKIYFWINSETTSILKVRSVLQKAILECFEDANIPMPDDARERIIITPDSTNNVIDEQTAQNKQSIGDKSRSIEQEENLEEVDSEVDDIREQARRSRSPESGENIL